MIGEIALLVWWYAWGVLVGIIIAVAIAFWIFYDAQQKWIEAMIWKTMAVVGALLTVPSLILKFSQNAILLSLATAPDPTAIINTMSYITLLAYAGILGMVLVLVAVFGYALSEERRADYGPTVRGTPLPPTRQVTPPPTAKSRPTPRPLPPTRLVQEKAPAAAWLAVKSGPEAGRQFNLKRGRNTIGRDGKSCNIVLDDGAASAEHARLQFERGQFVIYDLASLNGTFVNKKRVQRKPLMDGDTIRVGDTTFVFKQA